MGRPLLAPEVSVRSECPEPEWGAWHDFATQTDHGLPIVLMLPKFDQVLKARHREVSRTVASLLSLRHVLGTVEAGDITQASQALLTPVVLTSVTGVPAGAEP